jgi:hypothetical protein
MAWTFVAATRRRPATVLVIIGKVNPRPENKMLHCPKCRYQRRAEDRGDAGICPACGLVFAKWVSSTLGTARLPRERDTESDEAADRDGGGPVWLEQLTRVEPRTDSMLFWGRVGLYAVFVVWGLYFISLDLRTNAIGASFMHRVNLVFHEAGHVVFMPFGQFMYVLGGSLGQLLMPAIVCWVMVFRTRDNFGGSVALWWIGQSLKDLGPYINDARDLQLQLLTGHSQDVPETHDWANILLDLGLIYHEKKIALAADLIGNLIILLALAWGGYLLWQQYRNLERR